MSPNVVRNNSFLYYLGTVLGKQIHAVLPQSSSFGSILKENVFWLVTDCWVVQIPYFTLLDIKFRSKFAQNIG